MLVCQKCNKEFPGWVMVNGERKSLRGRKYCLKCSPYKKHSHPRKRTSPIWQIPIQDFLKVVSKNYSLSGVLRDLGVAVVAGNYITLKQRIESEKIDIQHIQLGCASNRGRRFSTQRIPMKEILVQDSTYSRVSLKRQKLK